MANLLSLPYELKFETLSLLDAISVIRCTLICKTFYQTLRDSGLYEYAVQLHLDGFKGGVKDDQCSYSEAIQELLRRRRVWMAGGPLQRSCRELGAHLEFKIVGSAVITYSLGQFKTLWLPPAISDEEHIIDTPSFPYSPTAPAWAADPTQDLLVLFTQATKQVYICSLRSKGLHPLAYTSTLDTSAYIHFGDRKDGIILLDVRMHIAGDKVALIVYITDEIHQGRRGTKGTKGTLRLMIWNWCSSEMLENADIGSEVTQNSRNCDFGFLDPTTYFLAYPFDSGYIRLYKLLSDPNFGATQTVHCATLHLPPVARASKVNSITSITSPIEAEQVPHSQYQMNDRDRLFEFQLWYDCMRGAGFPSQSEKYQLFVHQSAFTRYTTMEVSLGYSPVDVPWTDWGPRSTALFDATYAISKKTDMYAQRVVVGTSSRSRTCTIYDFSRAAVLYARRNLPPPAQKTVDLQETLNFQGSLHFCHRIPAFPLFSGGEELVTHLPCVSFERDFGSREYERFVINGDGIIGLKKDNEGGIDLDIYHG